MVKPEIDRLIEKAKVVREEAYSPYYKVKVGAALLADDDTIHVGCNVENISGSAIVCAESNAIGAAIASGQKSFKAIAVVAFPDKPLLPCGVCRQKLTEFAPKLTVYAATLNGDVQTYNLSELLPHPSEL